MTTRAISELEKESSKITSNKEYSQKHFENDENDAKYGNDGNGGNDRNDENGGNRGNEGVKGSGMGSRSRPPTLTLPPSLPPLAPVTNTLYANSNASSFSSDSTPPSPSPMISSNVEVTVVQMPSSHLNWNIVNTYTSPSMLNRKERGSDGRRSSDRGSDRGETDGRERSFFSPHTPNTPNTPQTPHTPLSPTSTDVIKLKRTPSFLQMLSGKGKTNASPKSGGKNGFLNMGMFMRKKSGSIADSSAFDMPHSAGCSSEEVEGVREREMTRDGRGDERGSGR